jgi:hypothetical protein
MMISLLENKEEKTSQKRRNVITNGVDRVGIREALVYRWATLNPV